MHLVKMACERPDDLGRSLSQWDCTEMARQLVRDGVVETISPETVRRILLHHQLKPWRQHMWLSPKVPRDAAFAARSRRSATCTRGRCGPTRWCCASTRRPACSRGRGRRPTVPPTRIDRSVSSTSTGVVGP